MKHPFAVYTLTLEAPWAGSQISEEIHIPLEEHYDEAEWKEIPEEKRAKIIESYTHDWAMDKLSWSWSVKP